MTLADKLRKARQERGVSQAVAAEGVGVSLRTYKSYELGESMPQNRQIMQRLADYYGLNINYLLTVGDDFVFSAEEKYGSKGRREARELIDQVIGLFAGGEMSEIDRDEAMQAIQQAYWDAKKENTKYTPKRYRDDSDKKEK